MGSEVLNSLTAAAAGGPRAEATARDAEGLHFHLALAKFHALLLVRLVCPL